MGISSSMIFKITDFKAQGTNSNRIREQGLEWFGKNLEILTLRLDRRGYWIDQVYEIIDRGKAYEY